ncbi:YceI family protein [Sediminicola luteus]|uniref:Lipid-binding protein n=1 Tax=Sediminicola luteus TaxID=319238 RepID=A0A2A4G4Y7_9FLAO|nr:YceI family protein [Sediminicola luteus]PCE63503.1 lipid-binding protein [Sediminicola luteus]
MKKSIFSLVIALVFANAQATEPIKGDKKDIKVSESTVVWKGHKVTGSHEGTINLKSGHLEMANGKLTGGSFTVDMASIACTDLEGEYKGKLEGHLKSDDFFGTANHPTASFTMKQVAATGADTYEITGDLTIKGKTHPISFVMTVNGNKAMAELKVDRTKYGIEYKSASIFSALGDKAIYDEFDLNVALQF